MDQNNPSANIAAHRLHETFGFLAVLIIAFVIFLTTCFRTITWWDSLNYTIAAHCLGVPAPPGSLLAVITGWLITRLVPAVQEAFALNLFAALAGALVAGLIFRAGWQVLHASALALDPATDKDHSCSFTALLVSGALTLALCDTLWLHATKFTPYVLTALLTSVILWLLLRWWQEADNPKAWHTLALVAFLLGLDFSIHRTNLLLVPGVVLWVIIRQPKQLSWIKAGLLAVAAGAFGLSIHFLQIPIASHEPFMNFNDPSTFGRFWDYISLKQYGGGWLLTILPRKAPFWSYQVSDYLKVFSTDFFSASGKAGFLGLLPALFGIVGLGVLFRRSWRLALGLVGLFVCAAFGAIIYFNIPADYFRPFDRHYLPSLVIFSVFILYGLAVTGAVTGHLVRNRLLSGIVITALLVALPATQLVRNYHARDASHNRFAYDFGSNLLATVPPNAILFTFGDLDSYAPWYLQTVEGQRPDVTVINVWLLNTPWYVEQLHKLDPLLPLTIRSEEIPTLQARELQDTIVTVSSENAPPACFHLSPGTQGKHMMAYEWAILDIISNNRFRRPVYFASGGGGNNPSWTSEHQAFEGLAFRLTPETTPPIDLDVLADNLFRKYRYTGYNDSSVAIEEASMFMAPIYWQMFYQYAMAAKSSPGNTDYAARRSQFLALMPPQRFVPAPGNIAQLLQAIEQGQI